MLIIHVFTRSSNHIVLREKFLRKFRNLRKVALTDITSASLLMVRPGAERYLDRSSSHVHVLIDHPIVVYYGRWLGKSMLT